MRLDHGYLLALLVPAPALVLGGCDAGTGSGSAPTSPAPSASTVPSTAAMPSASATGDGTVLVQLEKIEGALVEGFQLALRLESPPGHEVLDSTWADLLRRQKADRTLDGIYTFVVRARVPPGPFVLSTVMHPGMEPAQPTCVTRGQVETGAVVTVTVRFSDRDGCAVVS